jgi:hypothetical protein
MAWADRKASAKERKNENSHILPLRWKELQLIMMSILERRKTNPLVKIILQEYE